MPELPEVEMARRYLEATALHQTIQAAEVKDGRILARVSARELEEALAGKQFRCASRHGKRLFLKLHDSYLLPHRHPGGTCPRDGALLRREKIVGRTSYFCPEHQKKE